MHGRALAAPPVDPTLSHEERPNWNKIRNEIQIIHPTGPTRLSSPLLEHMHIARHPFHQSDDGKKKESRKRPDPEEREAE